MDSQIYKFSSKRWAFRALKISQSLPIPSSPALYAIDSAMNLPDDGIGMGRQILVVRRHQTQGEWLVFLTIGRLYVGDGG